MKKTTKLISLLLVAAMALALCACGKDGDDSNNGNGGKAENTPMPEYVYSSDFKTLTGSESYILPYIYTDDGFYSVQQEKVGEKEHETPAEYEGQYDIYETRLYFNSYDGKSSLLEDYAPVRMEANGETATSGINQLCQLSDGSMMALESLYLSWVDAPDTVDPQSEEYWNYYKYEQHFYLRKLDANGAELSCVELTGQGDSGEDFYPYNMAVSDDGKIVVTSDMLIRVYNEDGSVDFDISLDNYPENLLKLQDGGIGVLCYGNEGYGVQMIDFASRALGTTHKLVGWAGNPIPGGGEYDLYYTNGSNFVGYSFATETETKLFNWIDCDVNPNNLSGQYVLSDGRIVAISNDWSGTSNKVTTELVTINKVPSSSLPQKT